MISSVTSLGFETATVFGHIEKHQISPDDIKFAFEIITILVMIQEGTLPNHLIEIGNVILQAIHEVTPMEEVMYMQMVIKDMQEQTENELSKVFFEKLHEKTLEKSWTNLSKGETIPI